MRESVKGHPLDGRELIASAKNGDTQAFGQLVRTHQGIALRVAYLVVRDSSVSRPTVTVLLVATILVLANAGRALGKGPPSLSRSLVRQSSRLSS